MIDKNDDKYDHPDFEDAARVAACRELWEESGLVLSPGALVKMPAFNGRLSHWTFATVLGRRPDILGPQKKNWKEVTYQGCKEMTGAIPAGDDYHVWAEITILL